MAIGNAYNVRVRPGRMACAVWLAALTAGAVPTRAAGEPLVHCSRSPTGEIALDARGAPIGRVLDVIGAKSGFDVAIASGVTRRPVNATMAMAPVEHVLRNILRGRNYALVYDEDGALSEVIVLRPSDPRRVSRPPVRRGGAAARANRNRGPVVVRR